MEQIVIILLVILIVLVLVLIALFLLNKNNNNDQIERLGKFELNINKEINTFKDTLTKDLNEDFIKLNDNIEKRLILINEKVNERLDVNFEKTNKTFTSVIERLTKIDEAQKKIDGLSNDIVSLQGILTDKKTRGIFGEINLNNILSNVFGEKNDKVYQLQYKMPNGMMVDSILFAPKPLGTIAIDSKFPLENYRIMVDKKQDVTTRERAGKNFKEDVKKHIDVINNKYIINGFTADQAIMFLPAEAIFAEINAYHPDLVTYAYNKKIWITSPTTLMATLTIIQMILKNMERDKYTSIIHSHLNSLGVEFARYKERWGKLSRSIQTVNKDVENINVTSDKISKRFDSIHQVEVDTTKQLKED